MANEAQIRRIEKYEELLDELSFALEGLREAIGVFISAQDAAKRLERYYSGRLWKKDFLDDEAGRLPPSLKRGVLSEDALFDLLEENREMVGMIFGKDRDPAGPAG